MSIGTIPTKKVLALISNNLRMFWNRYQYFIIGLIFIVTILFIFLHGERLTSSKNFNDQKFTNFFVIIGSVATSISIIVFYYQLIEIRKERKLSSLPDLFPEDLFLEMRESSNELFDHLPSVFPINLENYDENFPTASLTLVNIGLGAAKEIIIKWEFDKTEIDSYIKGKYFYYENKNEFRYPFVSADKSVLVALPIYYLQSCGSKLNNDAIDELFNEPVMVKPSLTLELHYKDIYNNTYDKKFIVSIEGIYDKVTLRFSESSSLTY